MLIPPERLSADALQGLIEEFITREGTDYGTNELDLGTKVEDIRHQLNRGDVVIFYDNATETINLMTQRDYQKLNSLD
jgi:uncharacterized protein YheU (UPF0270 family)